MEQYHRKRSGKVLSCLQEKGLFFQKLLGVTLSLEIRMVLSFGDGEGASHMTVCDPFQGGRGKERSVTFLLLPFSQTPSP